MKIVLHSEALILPCYLLRGTQSAATMGTAEYRACIAITENIVQKKQAMQEPMVCAQSTNDKKKKEWTFLKPQQQDLGLLLSFLFLRQKNKSIATLVIS